MNNKKLLLLSFLTLITATVRPETTHDLQPLAAIETTLETTPANIKDICKMYAATTIPAILVGNFTGAAIGNLSNKLFDAIINKPTKNLIVDSYYDNSFRIAALTFVKLATQLACKYKWEKALRNKMIDWIIADLKKYSIDCNEEMMKTIARVSAWTGFARQLNSVR